MDAVCGLDDDWELLQPDQTSSFSMEEYCGNGHGGNMKGQLLLGAKLVMVDMDHFAAAPHRGPYGRVLDEEEANKPLLLPSRGVHGRQSAAPVTEFKDIGVIHMESKREEEEVTEILISDAEEGEEEEAIKFPDAVTKEVVQDEVLLAEAAAPPGHRLLAGEDDDDDEGVMNVGFSVGNLRVRGVGALCSFGVAAATFCIFLLGGGKQHHEGQNHKIQQLQMYADDQRIQRVTQQASRSRLNQTMGGAASARASISFGGHYRGFR